MEGNFGDWSSEVVGVGNVLPTSVSHRELRGIGDGGGGGGRGKGKGGEGGEGGGGGGVGIGESVEVVLGQGLRTSISSRW